MVAAENASYENMRKALAFYYARKLFVLFSGSTVKAAAIAGVSRQSFRRLMLDTVAATRIRGIENYAEQWGSWMAKEGASYRECLFVFSASLLRSAISRCNGNRRQAARMLKAHRNSMFKIPLSPADIKKCGTFKSSRRAQEATA